MSATDLLSMGGINDPDGVDPMLRLDTLTIRAYKRDGSNVCASASTAPRKTYSYTMDGAQPPNLTMLGALWSRPRDVSDQLTLYLLPNCRVGCTSMNANDQYIHRREAE